MSSRYVYAIAAILMLSVVHACVCRASLIWDGAYQFCMTLATQHPYVYKARFHTYFLWWPTVWASHFTSNPKILQAVYGLPFLMAPVAGLLISWWIVHKHAPNLIIWVVFGVAITSLPGQIFVINDSIFQQHLFWPVFLGLFVPLTWPKRVVLGVLAVFQFVHPLGAMLFLGAAIAAGLVAIADRLRRESLLIGAGIMFGLCLLALGKIYVSKYVPEWHDEYAEQQFTWDIALAEWRNGVLPWFDGLKWMYAAAALTFLQPLLRGRLRFVKPVAIVAALGAAGYGARHWWNIVKGPENVDFGVWWTGAIDYRRWVGPLTAPIFLLATAEVSLRAARENENNPRPGHPSPPRLSSPWLAPHAPLGLLMASILVLVLGMQYRSWDYETTRLMAQVEKYPSVIVPLLDKEFFWTWCTPCNHWATNNYVAVMQGKQPAKMFVNADLERMLRDDPPETEYPVDPSKPVKTVHSPPHHRCDFYPTARDNDLNVPPGPGGWFEFRPFLKELEKEPPTTRPRRAEKYP
jgi:hypothetical protein